MSLAGTANLVRLHTAGFEGLIFVIGPLLTGWHATAAGMMCLWWIGVLVNGYIFALNDVVDLPHDRANPARSHSPLVNGSVSYRAALGLAVVLPLLATTLVIAARWPAGAATTFVLMLALGAATNIYQKVTHHPVLMDLLYATTMAAPLPVTAQAYSNTTTPLLWSSTVTLFLLALQLNSIAGNLKDLRSDQSTGFRTIAVSLGAHLREDHTLIAGNRYRTYCWTVQAGVSIAAGVTVSLAVAGRGQGTITCVAVTSGVVLAVGTWDLWRLLSGRRQPSRTGREYYFASGFALLIVAVGLRSAPAPFWAVLAAVASWEVLARHFWNMHRRRTRLVADTASGK